MDRLRAFQESLLRQGIGAALVTSPDNIRYLTGYYHWNSLMPLAAAVVPARGDPVLLALRADETLAREASAVRVAVYDAGTQGFRATAGRAREALDAGALEPRKLGIEIATVTLDRYHVLEEVFPGCGFVDVAGALADLRLVKDEAEQATLRRAAHLVGTALERTIASLSPG